MKKASKIVCFILLLSLMLSGMNLNSGIAMGLPNEGVEFSDNGSAVCGDWTADVNVSRMNWEPSEPLQIQVMLQVGDDMLEKLADNKVKTDGFVMLVTAERTFDAGGIMRLASDEKMSTLLTVTGMPIEGGVQGAVTKRFGYDFGTPLDALSKIPLGSVERIDGKCVIIFNVSARLPSDLPPGLYRLRFDYGVSAGKSIYSFNATSFAQRGFPTGPSKSLSYSPLIRADGRDLKGLTVDAGSIKPRIPWVLLANYNSNGYRGVVADEDQKNFGLSSRNLIQDDVILPLYDEKNTKYKLSYNLEPQFTADTIDSDQNIPWNYSSGSLSIKVTSPDGKTADLGSAPFVDKSGVSPTTKNKAFTQWKPQMYGRYTVAATGWIDDIYGNRYYGGGTYEFWIAKRMTLATATFQGQSFQVGGKYGRDIGLSPAVPASVEVTATLYVNSDPNSAETVTYSGTATAGGVFGAAQGMKPLTFDQPGEYRAKILAKYTDADGHLWVESMSHAGVVYPADTSITAHGKMVQIGKDLLPRGDTNLEGWHDLHTDAMQLQHINFPYNAGDVLLIASDGQGANKIEPVLTWSDNNKPAAYDKKIQGIGLTNIKIQTSNGYSPHMFPEYITDFEYYYASAPRPGMMGRFIVGENGTRAPYWPTSTQNFGGQYDATSNGDSPGDIYRLLGGVVIRKKGQSPLYAGYMANAAIMAKGSNDNRVIAPASEDILGPTGQKARVFIAMNARPGMVYNVGTAFAPALQIDPIVPINISFTLTYPDGRQVVASGVGDSTGSFAGKDKWILDIPGVYTYKIDSDYMGYPGLVPGMLNGEGKIYVIENQKPAGAAGITFDLPPLSKIDPVSGATFTGKSTADEVDYAVIIPGAVLQQGTIPVVNGKFQYVFDPQAFHAIAHTYDTTNTNSGKPELGDIVHLTFFSKETAPDGTPYHSFVRLILHGATLNYTK